MTAPRIEFGLVGFAGAGMRIANRAAVEGMRVVAHGGATAKPAEGVPGVELEDNLATLRQALAPPRILLVDVPADAVDEALEELAPYGDSGDVIVDIGDGYWADTIRRNARLRSRGVAYLDVGVVVPPDEPRRVGYFFVGGDGAAVARLGTVLAPLASAQGFVHVGASGAGHFAKAVLAGVQSGVAEALTEGVGLLQHFRSPIDVDRILRCWRMGRLLAPWPTLHAAGSRLRRSHPLHRLVADAMDFEAHVPVIAESVFRLFAEHGEGTVGGEPAAPRPASARDLLEQWARAGYDARLRRIKGSYAFDIEAVGWFRVDIDDGKVAVRQLPQPEEADCVVACNEQDFLRITSGKESLIVAVLQGRVTVRGDVALAQKLNGLAGLPAPGWL
jgi:6-phosphogluconate dehydrogenase